MQKHDDTPDSELDLELSRDLARLTAATASITPREGYQASLLVLLGATTANDVSSVVFRFGRIGVAIGALVAAASIALAMNSSLDQDQEDAIAYGTEEYFE